MKKLATIVIVLAMAGVAQASITVTLDPTHDGMTRSGIYADQNNEIGPNIDIWRAFVQDHSTSEDDDTANHFRYDLSSITDTVLSATLRFHTMYTLQGVVPGDFSISLHDEAGDGAWDESTITWDNAPTDYNTTLGNVTDDGSRVTGDTLDFTSQALVDALNDDIDDILDLRLFGVTQDSSILVFNKEDTVAAWPHDHGTQLIVDFVPEPATLTVLALGGLAALIRRRR